MPNVHHGSEVKSASSVSYCQSGYLHHDATVACPRTIFTRSLTDVACLAKSCAAIFHSTPWCGQILHGGKSSHHPGMGVTQSFLPLCPSQLYRTLQAHGDVVPSSTPTGSKWNGHLSEKPMPYCIKRNGPWHVCSSYIYLGLRMVRPLYLLSDLIILQWSPKLWMGWASDLTLMHMLGAKRGLGQSTDRAAQSMDLRFAQPIHGLSLA